MVTINNFDQFICEKYSRHVEYSVGQCVLIRYPLTGDITNVKIVKKITYNNYIVSFKVEGSHLFNAPDLEIKASQIIGVYNDLTAPSEVKLSKTENPNIRPYVGGVIPTWNSYNNDISL